MNDQTDLLWFFIFLIIGIFFSAACLKNFKFKSKRFISLLATSICVVGLMYFFIRSYKLIHPLVFIILTLMASVAAIRAVYHWRRM